MGVGVYAITHLHSCYNSASLTEQIHLLGQLLDPSSWFWQISIAYIIGVAVGMGLSLNEILQRYED